MTILGNNKDRFGFYRVGEFKTYSKIEAIELHRRLGIHPHWDFNEAEFSQYDWTQEPVESLEQLYAKRAWQIRNAYDHLVLFYSGGADSMQVLNTFIKNKIPFEEIVTYNYESAEPDPNSFFNGELVHVAYPDIKRWQDAGVKFQHRHIDLSQISYDILHSKKFDLDRGYYSNSLFGMNNLARSHIREKTDDYQQIINRGKKLVFVWGADKPRLYRENNRYCLKFLDIIDSAVNPRTQIVNREDEYDELFFWSPDALDLMCKQGHVLRRFVIANQLFSDKKDRYDIREEENIRYIDPMTGRERYTNYRNAINILIYQGFDPNTYSVGKPASKLFSPREAVFIKDVVFREKMTKLSDHLSQLDSYWLNDPTNIQKGIKLCISPAYYLE